MKSQKGITLISLILYVIVLLVITAIIGTISTFFYKNIKNINEDSKSVAEFNKFNMYFLEEVKRDNNNVDEISEDKTAISFKSGNSFLYKDNAIFFNGVKICNDVNSASFKFYEESGTQNNRIVVVNLSIGKNFSYSKTMNYVLESISI